MSKSFSWFLTFTAAFSLMFLAQEYLLPYYYASTIQERIKNKYPLMTLISKKSPVEFNAYIKKLKENILNHGDANNEFYYSATLINTEFSKYATKASNKSLYNFLGSEIHLYKRLFQSNPAFVLFIEFPQQFKGNIRLSALNNNLNNNDVKTLEKSKEEVITSAMENKNLLAFSDVEQNTASAILAKIIANLNSQYGQPLVSSSLLKPATAELSQKREAEIIISYYEQIYAEGPERAGEVLRVIYATNTATAAR